MKKRLAMATIAALAALTLAACGGGAEETTAAATEAAEAAGEAAEEAPAEEAPAEEAEAKEEYVIGMVTYSLAEEFGVDVVDGALAKAEEIGGIEIVYPDAAGDMQKSISIVEDMTTQGIDAICIAPVDADAIIPYIDKAREAGIVVVNWDIETQAEVDAKILTDNFEGGAMGADYLVERMGDEGTVLIVDDLESVTSTYERNKGFEDRMKENRMAEIDALGIYNIFKIEPTQDLVALADYLSSRIGLNLAVLADIHHLRSIDVEPLFPKLFKQYFPALYAQKELRLQVAEEYKRSYRWLKNEENDLQAIGDVRDAQMLRLETRLELTREEEAQKTTEELLRTYAKDNMGLKKTSVSFEELLDWARNHMESKDIPFFTNWVKNVDNPKVSRKINGKILDLEQHVKQR